MKLNPQKSEDEQVCSCCTGKLHDMSTGVGGSEARGECIGRSFSRSVRRTYSRPAQMSFHWTGPPPRG